MFTPLQCIFSEVTYQHWLFRDSTTQAQALSHVNIGSVLSRICFETPDSLWRKGLATNRFRDKWSRPQERFLFLQTVRSFKTNARQNAANIHVTQSLRLHGQISEKSVLKKDIAMA